MRSQKTKKRERQVKCIFTKKLYELVYLLHVYTMQLRLPTETKDQGSNSNNFSKQIKCNYCKVNNRKGAYVIIEENWPQPSGGLPYRGNLREN
jgi:hypothetical protein